MNLIRVKDKLRDITFLVEVNQRGRERADGLEAIELALECIDKQIPKKPIAYYDEFNDGMPIHESIECPNCGSCHTYDYEWYKHCPNCGQAIDWSINDVY